MPVSRCVCVRECRFDCAPPPITAAVSIYFDGSVLITPGGLEMGQGLHTKVKQARIILVLLCRHCYIYMQSELSETGCAYFIFFYQGWHGVGSSSCCI